jgi:hypothetical protein
VNTTTLYESTAKLRGNNMDQAQISRAIYLFHDGTISTLERKLNDLIIQVNIPYLAEMLNSEYSCFTLTLSQCEEIYLQYWMSETMEFDLETISKLELEINKAKNEDGYIQISCMISNPDIVGGDLIIKTTGLKIADQNESEVTLSDLETLAKNYWNQFK